jgi:uncharacterized Tic20 family protein
MSVADELEKVEQLRQSGAISDEEYAAAKARILHSASEDVPTSASSVNAEQQTRLWATLLHLSQFANIFAPSAGIIAPILIWQIKKKDLPDLNMHGKIVVNWFLSTLSYGIAYFLLSFLAMEMPLFVGSQNDVAIEGSLITASIAMGMLLFALLGILAVVFPIIGGLKANNGEVWKYPLSITFFE